MTIGIYCIENTINNKLYIGQSINIERRKKKHFTQLRTNNKKENPHLLNSFNLYGESAFVFNIIEIVSDKEQLEDREEYWIGYYRGLNRELYNSRPASKSNAGIKRSIESNQKISKALYKPVEQIDISTNSIVKIWDSPTVAALELGIDVRYIYKVCSGVMKKYYNYKWRYHENILRYT